MKSKWPRYGCADALFDGKFNCSYHIHLYTMVQCAANATITVAGAVAAAFALYSCVAFAAASTSIDAVTFASAIAIVIFATSVSDFTWQAFSE